MSLRQLALVENTNHVFCLWLRLTAFSDRNTIVRQVLHFQVLCRYSENPLDGGGLTLKQA